MTELSIARMSTTEADFWTRLESLSAWEEVADEQLESTVREIVAAVRRRGDAALLEFTNRFDRTGASAVSQLAVPGERLKKALASIESRELAALREAAARIRAFHERQCTESWSYSEPDGSRFGQQVTPLDRVGLYVPGGKASYPSSVLMNAIPAKVAGVEEVVLAVPSPDGEVNELVLAAAAIAQVDRVFTVGGAQAIAALAFGTESIPKVDKIVGPGNAYVATAKRMVFGVVGIDMIAGPSEILVVCDGLTDPEWIAMDLFSQAEHDEQAQPILVSPDERFLERVASAMTELLPEMERRETIRVSLANRGAFILVRNLDEAADVVNFVAPEHLELSVEDAEAMLPRIRHAGAIFMGRHTAEALGDYCAGPNHVLPTSRTARFSSPLGVYDFQKRTSLIFCTPEGAHRLGKTAATLARGEGLTAHARSAEFRVRAGE